jgi:hypothetical protein
MSLHAQSIRVEVQSLGMERSALEWRQIPWNGGAIGKVISSSFYAYVEHTNLIFVCVLYIN